MTHDRGMVFPLAGSGRVDAIEVYLGNSGEEELQAVLRLRGATSAEDLSSTEDLLRATAAVAPHSENWVRFDLNATIETPYAWFFLEKRPALTWRLMESAPPGCFRFYGDADSRSWTPQKGERYAFRLSPPLAVAADFAPEYVINGVARAWDGNSNMWASDPASPLPQWIQLSFPAPTRLNTVYLTLDTNLDPRRHGPARPREAVKDYRLEAWQHEQWRTLAAVTGNVQRRNVLRFEPVTTDRIRVVITATNGDKSARVFEIRAYDE